MSCCLLEWSALPAKTGRVLEGNGRNPHQKLNPSGRLMKAWHHHFRGLLTSSIKSQKEQILIHQWTGEKMDHCTDAISSIKRLYRFIQWYQSSDTRKSCLDYALFLKNKTKHVTWAEDTRVLATSSLKLPSSVILVTIITAVEVYCGAFSNRSIKTTSIFEQGIVGCSKHLTEQSARVKELKTGFKLS